MVARLHAAMVEDQVASMGKGDFALEVAWALEKGEDPPSDWPVAGIGNCRQHGVDLGERMYNAILEAGSRYPSVIVIGSDHPGLAAAVVEEGFALLETGADVVIGPAEDGGYYLIGCRVAALDPRLFSDIEWSTPQVLMQTRARCREVGVRAEVLPSARDIDDAEDLRWLEESLKAGTLISPRVAALLSAWCEAR